MCGARYCYCVVRRTPVSPQVGGWGDDLVQGWDGDEESTSRNGNGPSEVVIDNKCVSIVRFNHINTVRLPIPTSLYKEIECCNRLLDRQ